MCKISFLDVYGIFILRMSAQFILEARWFAIYSFHASFPCFACMTLVVVLHAALMTLVLRIAVCALMLFWKLELSQIYLKVALVVPLTFHEIFKLIINTNI